MNKEKNNLISASELKKKLNNKKIKILDARWFLEDSQKGKKLYDKRETKKRRDIEKEINREMKRNR